MKTKIIIVTDSTACFTKEQLKKYPIKIVPIHIVLGGKIYRDFIELTPKKAYQFLEENPNEWKSSAPPPGDFLNVFEEIAQQENKIICLTLARELSTTFNSAYFAKKIIEKKFPSTKIEIIDTETASVGENLLAIEASKMVEEGKKFEEIVNFIKKLRKKVEVYGILDNIRYAFRTGRIPKITSKLGSLLSLKPILRLSNGKISFVGILRNKEKGKERLLKILKKYHNQKFPEIGISHADCRKEAEDFKIKIKKELPKTEIFISEFSPVMGYGTGRGTILIGFFGK